MAKDLIIRSSAEEFITFKVQEKDKGIQVRYENENLWMTQKAIAELFDVQRPAITKHLNNIFNEDELDKNSVCSKMKHTAEDGKKYQTEYYNLDAIISVGYDSKSPITINFFKKIQNKMHYAVSKQTAAEIIYDRADSEKENMGLTSWRNSPSGKITESDVVIAKNYLSKEELEDLERIVNAFLEIAENRARRHIPMTMEDWATRIDKFLLADDRDILKDAGKISHEIACDKALTEFEKYRVKQDKLYKSDFDLLMEESEDYNT